MSEKNLEATPHHLQEARKKGQVAVSEDLLRSAACIVVFEASAMLARRYGSLWLQYFSDYLGQASRLEKGVRWDANNMFVWIAFGCMLTLTIGLASVAVTLALRWMQTGGPVIVESPFTFKPEKFDPSQMFGRIFSKKTFTTLIGSLLKTALVAFLCWLSTRDVFAVMAQSTDRSLPAMVGLVGEHVLHFLRNALMALLAVSILDVFIQRKLHMDQMKMSHEDVKQEMKSTEGNTEVKQHVRGMAHEILNAPVPNAPRDPLMGANALVVNPTHLAVGLRFIEAEQRPPVICVKAEEQDALQMIEAAMARDIPVVRHIVLARTLYLEPSGSLVPRSTYSMVAAVYRSLKKLESARSPMVEEAPIPQNG